MSASRSGNSTVCAFVALELPRALQSGLAVEVERLEQDYPDVAWVSPRKMHLTLRFLGWTTRERLACLEPYLARAARSCPPLDATVAGLGTFPPTTVQRARVMWAGVTLPKAGKTLQAACEAAAIECGFPPERRAFVPHLTLGRFRTPARLRSISKLDLGATRLETLVLYRTEPAPSEPSVPGVRRAATAYSKLATFTLG